MSWRVIVGAIVTAALVSGCGSSANVAGSAPLTRQEVDALPPVTLDEVASAVSSVAVANPAVGLDTPQFQHLLVDELNRVGRGRSYSIDGASPAELWLLATHPSAVGRTFASRDDAMAETARRFRGVNAYQNKADAFRHAYWTVLLSKRVDVGWAEAFCTAHESQSSGADRMMDLNNNAVGRRVFRENPGRSESQHGDRILQYPVYLGCVTSTNDSRLDILKW